MLSALMPETLLHVSHATFATYYLLKHTSVPVRPTLRRRPNQIKVQQNKRESLNAACSNICSYPIREVALGRHNNNNDLTTNASHSACFVRHLLIACLAIRGTLTRRVPTNLRVSRCGSKMVRMRRNYRGLGVCASASTPHQTNTKHSRLLCI